MTRFRSFTTMNLVLITMMAALGIAIKPIVTPLAQIITGPMMIPGGVVAGGFYMLWLVLAYGLTGNKPGSALLVGLVQGIIIMLQPIANHGAFSLVSYAAPGLAVDLFYLFARPGPTTPLKAFFGGAAANITGSFLVTVVLLGIVVWRMPWVFVLLMIFTATLSGGLGGLVAYALLGKLRQFNVLGGSGQGD